MKKLLTFGLILILTFLTGCSIAFDFYVRNFTDDPYVLKIFSNSRTKVNQMVPNYVLIKNKILEINGKTRRETIDTLRTAITNDTLIVQIPPKSTIIFPHFIAGYEEIQERKFKVDGLLITDSERVDTFPIYPSRVTDKIKRKSGFFQVIDYYDIVLNAR